MAKPPKVAYEFSDAEKRDLVQLIQQGKALPENYEFVCVDPSRGGSNIPRTFRRLIANVADYPEVVQ